MSQLRVDKQQKLWIELMGSSPDLFAICNPIINPNYFVPEYKRVVAFMQEYYSSHNTLPSFEMMGTYTDDDFRARTVTQDVFDYTCETMERFCRQSATKREILEASKLIERHLDDDTDDYFGTIETKIKQAVTIALPKNRGINFFKDVRAGLLKTQTQDVYISTGWADVDELLGGGVNRKTLVLFSAGSGGGKSVTMQNMALNFAKQQLRGVYFSLELSEELINERLATIVTGIPKREMAQRWEEAATEIEMMESEHGDLVVIQLPVGTTANQIDAEIKQIQLTEGWTPDYIVVDYLDLMAPNDKHGVDGTFEKDKRTSEDLRNLARKWDLVAITASQLNRSAVNATDIDHSHIAGGISKINTADLYIAIIMNDIMKAKGELLFDFQKTRTSDAVGTILSMLWGKSNMTIKCKPKDDDNRFILPGQHATNAPQNSNGARGKPFDPQQIKTKSGKDLATLMTNIQGS